MANRKVSSFVKRGKTQDNPIPGTKVSIQNSQLLISSGIPSFDKYIGGGLPVGSLLLVDEDTSGILAKIFMKYFLAEGMVSKQAVHVCSKDVDPEQLVSELPGSVTCNRSDADTENIKDEEMTIAWRYQNMKLVSSQNSNPSYIGHYFDLTKTDLGMKKNADVSFWYTDKDSAGTLFEETDYGNLLKSIKEVLHNGKYLISDARNERKILRLGLFCIGSPLWSKTDKFLTVFLYSLRAFLRNSFATCMVTIPFHLYENENLKDHCIHLSDICIQLESFFGTPLEENAALRDYNGFFRIMKRAAINGLTNGDSQIVDLAIKLRRRKLTIEKLHLPPELEDTTQREQGGSGDISCGSSKSRVLEF